MATTKTLKANETVNTTDGTVKTATVESTALSVYAPIDKIILGDKTHKGIASEVKACAVEGFKLGNRIADIMLPLLDAWQMAKANKVSMVDFTARYFDPSVKTLTKDQAMGGYTDSDGLKHKGNVYFNFVNNTTRKAKEYLDDIAAREARELMNKKQLALTNGVNEQELKEALTVIEEKDGKQVHSILTGTAAVEAVEELIKEAALPEIKLADGTVREGAFVKTPTGDYVEVEKAIESITEISSQKPKADRRDGKVIELQLQNILGETFTSITETIRSTFGKAYASQTEAVDSKVAKAIEEMFRRVSMQYGKDVAKEGGQFDKVIKGWKVKTDAVTK